MDFKSIFPPSATRPRPPKIGSLADAFRLNLSVTSIILFGASVQSLLFMLPISNLYSIAPAFAVLLIRFINTMLITYGVLPNPYLEGAQMKKTTVQLPDLNGQFGPPGNEKITILLLGAKSNHPLGTFAPDFPKTLKYVEIMTDELEKDPKQESGFLGQTFYTRKDSKGANEFVIISYWRSLADVHRYAHGPTHKEAWKWWDSTIKSHNYIGFMHEVFEADKGKWESVYINFQPTLAAATTVLRKEGKLVGGSVGEEWICPLLEARGKLRTSNGRRGVGDTKEVEEMFKGNTYES